VFNEQNIHSLTFDIPPKKSTFLVQFDELGGIVKRFRSIYCAWLDGHLFKKSESGKSDGDFDLSHLDFDGMSLNHLWSPLWTIPIIHEHYPR
jgi:hypothetical protein